MKIGVVKIVLCLPYSLSASAFATPTSYVWLAMLAPCMHINPVFILYFLGIARYLFLCMPPALGTCALSVSAFRTEIVGTC